MSLKDLCNGPNTFMGVPYATEIAGAHAAVLGIPFDVGTHAFRVGAPPHGGLARGLDRIAMLVSGEDSIREVIAFPKNNKGADLMAQSPCEIGMKELREVYVQSTYKKKTEEPVK